MANDILPPLPPVPVDAPQINIQYRHTGNGQIYNVVGYAWLGDTDQWAVLYQRRGHHVVFCRTIENFNGNRANGQKRFEAL